MDKNENIDSNWQQVWLGIEPMDFQFLSSNPGPAKSFIDFFLLFDHND